MRGCNSLFISGSLAALLLLSGPVLGQTLQPKGTPEAQAPAPAPGSNPAAQQAPQAATPPKPRPNWELSCDPVSAGLNCRVKQTLVGRRSKKPLLTVFVAVPAKTKKPVMLVRLPLGIYLPAGATVKFGEGEPKPLVLQRCGTSGCYAEYEVTQAEIDAMVKGSDLTVSAESRQRKPLRFVVRAEGFSDVYSRIR